MSNIPVDLNQTMWDIADRCDAAAAAEFSEKFPALAKDMENRMVMITGMKSVRASISRGFVPRFSLRRQPAHGKKLLRLAPAALALAALAGASFYVVQNLLTPLPDASIFGHPEIKKPQRHAAPKTTVLPPRPPLENYEGDAPKPVGKGTGGGPAPSNPEIRLTQVHLINAIQAVGQRFGKRVEIPPNFPNPIVDVDISCSDTLTGLDQLGNQFGFSAYDEGDHYIVIPARDDQPSQ